MLQFFRLRLDCGHSFEQSAVREYENEPYRPNYVGQEIVCDRNGCRKIANVTAQERIGALTGSTE